MIANAVGEFREARALFLESIGSFVRPGNSTHAMSAYNNLGLSHAGLREWMEAEVYFSRGIEIGERLSHHAGVALLQRRRAVDPGGRAGTDAGHAGPRRASHVAPCR